MTKKKKEEITHYDVEDFRALGMKINNGCAEMNDVYEMINYVVKHPYQYPNHPALGFMKVFFEAQLIRNGGRLKAIHYVSLYVPEDPDFFINHFTLIHEDYSCEDFDFDEDWFYERSNSYTEDWR